MGLNLSISNIAWTSKDDERMYIYMKDKGFKGLEIAPTRNFLNDPYLKVKEAKEFALKIFYKYGLSISSLQSIWHGKSEKLFETEVERDRLLGYTKEAILFAESVGAGNLVFGCPQNRCTKQPEDRKIAISFFRELGEYALSHGTVLAMEPNPVIYGTNFINSTRDAIELIKEVGSQGFKLNLDFGTMIYNGEQIGDFIQDISLINHVHISEPNLKLIRSRKEHKDLIKVLRDNEYSGFVSIEMGRQENLSNVFAVIDYVSGL